MRIDLSDCSGCDRLGAGGDFWCYKHAGTPVTGVEGSGGSIRVDSLQTIPFGSGGSSRLRLGFEGDQVNHFSVKNPVPCGGIGTRCGRR